MKQALISPNEDVYVYGYGNVGKRIAEVSAVTFQVSPPLFWAECPDYVTAEGYYYNQNSNSFAVIPAPLPPPTE